MPENPQLQLASEYMHATNRSVFLTGKAGTGKTTFLRTLKQTISKRMAIVAPTGVAAMNAGGVTIHSLFQFPFGPYVPDSQAQEVYRFSKQRIELIKSLDLLVMDEISMVRADLLDRIDAVLRRFRNPARPFGGLQLLLIGDLHQLPPVVREEDWALLKPYYKSGYFFDSLALQKTAPVRIELTRIYRQSDAAFIDLLNRIRDNRVDESSLELLNSRYLPDFTRGDNDGYILLTTHNFRAQTVNSTKLERIGGQSHSFDAEISGDFPAYSFPTEEKLELKAGAQVMFVKNDTSGEKRYYNGKIGRISRIDGSLIFVACEGDYEEIAVERQEWTNVRYVLNPATRKVEEEIIGSFRQFPLKLAWAITIHKSQGLTFEKAVIDAGSAFTHGQVYVALSRCKSLEGMVLSSQIKAESILTDQKVESYSRETEANPPRPEDLRKEKIQFQTELLTELFGFEGIGRGLAALKRLVDGTPGLLPESGKAAFAGMESSFTSEITAVADRFRAQLATLTGDDEPEKNDALQARVRKAATYFRSKVDDVFEGTLSALAPETDNAQVKKSWQEAMEKLQKVVFVKKACLDACGGGFTAIGYVQARADADLSFGEKKNVSRKTEAPRHITHGPLYEKLKAWRREVAFTQGIPDYLVLQVKTLVELAETQPLTLRRLGAIKGIGKTKSKYFGEVLLEMIREYRLSNDLPVTETENEEVPLPKPPKKGSREQSYELFLQGKSLAEIAGERGYVQSTIENHLLHYIGTGELSVYTLYEEEKVNKIIAYLEERGQVSVSEAKNDLGDEVGWSEIRAVMQHLKQEER